MTKVNSSEMRSVAGGGYYYCYACRKAFWAAGAFGVGCHVLANGGSKKHWSGCVRKY